jgi:hypothetical protein
MQRFNVIKIMKKSGRTSIIEKGLTEAESQRYVQNDIEENGSNSRSIICYTKQ